MIIVLLSLTILIVFLYLDKIRPSILFLITITLFLISGILTPEEILAGLSNKQIIVIFLLIILSSGLRKVIGNNVFGYIFKNGISPRYFLLRMMAIVSSSSAFLNNTPIVAFMIPYVKDWADKNKQPASKFLMPLSFATILGGMITVIGTSTNLVLNGLITQSGQKSLEYSDFLFLGIFVTIAGLVYLYFVGYHILPSNENTITNIQENIKEYLVETHVKPGSPLVGKSVKNAGLRSLHDIYLVEIYRDGNYISPVNPDEILKSNDYLFFTGKTSAIHNLISQSNGLSLPDEEAIEKYQHFSFAEAIIPANSTLIDEKVKESDFRNRFNSSIIAVHRHGKKVNEKIGEIVFNSGDLLLLLGADKLNFSPSELLLISKKEEKLKESKKPVWFKILSIISFGFLISGIAGLMDLFTAVMLSIMVLIGIKVINYSDIKKSIDFDLVILLISALAIGVSLTKTGAADYLANGILYLHDYVGSIGVLTALFVATILLTSLITNAAAVSIVFPVASALAVKSGVEATPYFIAIAFAASGDFMTPIGYQTNLMVMGPGGYSFKDFFKVGIWFTLIYTLICITFITQYYNI